MEKYLKKISQISSITSIIFIVIGLFLIIKPETTLSLISYVLGIVILVNGIMNLVRYFSNRGNGNLYDFGFIIGIISVVIAVIFISNPNMIASIIPLILGVWILVNGVVKFQFSMNLKNYRNSNTNRSMIISGFNILLGIILVLNPFKGAVLITRIIGAFLIAYAILDLLESRTIKKTLQDGVEFIK